MNRKQITLLFMYFDDRTENTLVRFEKERLYKEIDLPTRRYMEQTVENAIDPEVDVRKYFYTIARLATIKNTTFQLISEQYTCDWDQQKKGLVKATNTLLKSLGLPTYRL